MSSENNIGGAINNTIISGVSSLSDVAYSIGKK